MITWMQRHRKYLVITIWISTIAFIGAGFVGWGEYKYGDKAGAVAKVGTITITQEELQKSYSTLFNQYNQMFQGKLDVINSKRTLLITRSVEMYRLAAADAERSRKAAALLNEFPADQNNNDKKRKP